MIRARPLTLMLWLGTALLVLWLSGCGPSLANIRLDVRCVARAVPGDAVVMDCADRETWEEWRQKQGKPT